MAAEDSGVKVVIVKYFLPAVAVLIALRYFVKNRKTLRLRLIAWVSDTMLRRLHKLMQKEKDIVFDELGNIARESDGNLQVLEIGSGSGCNFKHFPSGTEIICLDPNPYNKTYIEKNIKQINPEVSLKQFVVGFAESMPEVEDNSCDAVVCTLVLCTVTDLDAVMKEVKRVLKPNGVFLFVEHVASRQGTFKRRIQNLLNPLWKVLCDGCNINRETWNIVKRAGFSNVDLTHFTLTALYMSTPCIYGQAVK